MCSKMTPSTGGEEVHKDSSDLLSDVLDCPVCLESLRPPIWQCHEGHIFCDRCSRKVTSCPNCRADLSCKGRNRALEGILRKATLPCRYADAGCAIRLKLSDLEQHEAACPCHPIKCPSFSPSRRNRCRWRGSHEGLLEHLKTEHDAKMRVFAKGRPIVDILSNPNGVEGAHWGPFLYTYDNDYIMLDVYHSPPDKEYRGVVRHINTHPKASTQPIHYKVFFQNDRQRLLWEAVARSVHESAKVVAQSGDCFTIKENLALLLSGCKTPHVAQPLAKMRLTMHLSFSRGLAQESGTE